MYRHHLQGIKDQGHLLAMCFLQWYFPGYMTRHISSVCPYSYVPSGTCCWPLAEHRYWPQWVFALAQCAQSRSPNQRRPSEREESCTAALWSRGWDDSSWKPDTWGWGYEGSNNKSKDKKTLLQVLFWVPRMLDRRGGKTHVSKCFWHELQVKSGPIRARNNNCFPCWMGQHFPRCLRRTIKVLNAAKPRGEYWNQHQQGTANMTSRKGTQHGPSYKPE